MTIDAVAIIEASAPGKLFLLGEYAVLDGAPGLLTAVDRRVTVTVAPSDDDRWHLSTPGLDLDALTLEADGSIPAGLDGRTHTHSFGFSTRCGRWCAARAPFRSPSTARHSSPRGTSWGWDLARRLPQR